MRVKKMSETAKLPTKAHDTDAGFDLYANITHDIIIAPGATLPIGTGIAMEIPEGCFGALYARSGLATKKGLRPANCVGVIDSDYRNEIIVAIHNDSMISQKISAQERIAQLVIQKFENVDLEEVSELNETERGLGGFGSSGTM